MFRFLTFLYQEKENRSASPEKQVDKEREGEAVICLDKMLAKYLLLGEFS